MRRIAILLMVLVSVPLAASGVAWAVTKTCPPEPKKCWGTNGADVLKSSSKNNLMYGKRGNDTYTHFVRGNSGSDFIGDLGGRDKIVLTNYSRSEVKGLPVDSNNGKADSLLLKLGKGSQNEVWIGAFFNDKKSKAPFPPGFGR